MPCKRPVKCQATSKPTNARCKRCIGKKGVAGAHCTACYQHKKQECRNKRNRPVVHEI